MIGGVRRVPGNWHPYPMFCLSLQLFRCLEYDAKADGPQGSVRSLLRAYSRAVVYCPMIETFAANDFELPRRWPTWINCWAVRILAHPIRTPLANVSVHIVKTKSVRCFTSDGMGTLIRVFRIPSVVRKFSAIISEAVCSRRTAATCHFPFGFSWQTVNPFIGFFFRPSRKAITELLGLVPSHVLDRQAVGIWRIPEITWIFAHDRLVLSLCDFMNAELIVSTYGNFMLW